MILLGPAVIAAGLGLGTAATTAWLLWQLGEWQDRDGGNDL